jgi:hypothetical protein
MASKRSKPPKRGARRSGTPKRGKTSRGKVETKPLRKGSAPKSTRRSGSAAKRSNVHGAGTGLRGSRPAGGRTAGGRTPPGVTSSDGRTDSDIGVGGVSMDSSHVDVGEAEQRAGDSIASGSTFGREQGRTDGVVEG